MPTRATLILFAILTMTFSLTDLHADVAATAVAPAATEAVVSTAVADVPPAGEAAQASAPVSDGLVSLDFQDADIRNVLKVLAYKSGMNIVTSPDVVGNVTIQLNDVPWKKALEVILSTYGFGYQRDGNIITVMSVDGLKKYREDTTSLQEQEPLGTKTYRLSFAKASDVVDSISKVKTARGSINFDQRTNTIIVRDVQSALELTDDVVKTLDTVTPQVLIEAKVIETDLDATDKLGIDWTAQAEASSGKRPLLFPFTQTQSSKFLPGNFSTPSSGFTYGTLDLSGVSAVFEMLNSRGNTNILSNPKIVTLDNQPAKIVVGTQYPIPDYTYNAEQAKMQVSGWNYKDIGIIFEVTPHVNNTNMVTLDLHPTITEINGTVTVEGTSLPQLSIEETVTKVMIANGQTLVIAGLIKDKTVTTDKKMPFLGDVPIVGQAFKNNTKVKTKTELLIFLTPRIITLDHKTGEEIHAPAANAP